MRWAGSRDRIILVSLVISFFFHLSMVTLFRIVIYFPKEPIVYYDLRIVDSTSYSVLADSLQETLEVPSSESAAERFADDSVREDRWSSLPPVTLPTLQFSELDMVRLNQTGLNTRTRYEDLFQEEANDLWSRFGRKLSTVGDILSHSNSEVVSSLSKPQAILAGRPAPGFEAYIEWMSEPYDRQPLMVQKIEALWGADASALSTPLVFIFRVNKAGRVTFIQVPFEDEDGLVDSSAQAIFGFRFEQLLGDESEIQHGTIIIRPEVAKR
jgi:hypothetical protein